LLNFACRTAFSELATFSTQCVDAAEGGIDLQMARANPALK
jgi:hypothetical protein